MTLNVEQGGPETERAFRAQRSILGVQRNDLREHTSDLTAQKTNLREQTSIMETKHTGPLLKCIACQALTSKIFPILIPKCGRCSKLIGT